MLIFLLSIYIISSLWAILSIILYGNRPARSISWILITIIFPYLGVVLYIIFGINRKRFKFFSLNFNAKRKLYDLQHKSDNIQEFAHKFDANKYESVGDLMKKSSGFPAVDGNNVTMYFDGASNFEALYSALENAQKFIHIQYYIIENGEIFNRFLEIFKQKLQQGVEIRVLYDAFGSYDFKKKSVDILESLGVEVHAILPLKFGNILSTINFRNHRKIMIIDGKIAFTGGMNVSDKYIKNDNELGIWDDLHIKITGAAVDHLHRIFIKDYYFATNEILLSEENYLPKQTKKGDTLLQIVTGGPDHTYLSILHQYSMMIHAAKKSIYIENPYFIPNKTLLEALKMAVLRGVDVKIMVPKNNDSRIAKYSMFSNFQDLLKTGAKIYILKNTFSHSKLIIIDDEIASVGSGNFDYRSFEHNYEVNTIIYDNNIANTLSEKFITNTQKCLVLDYDSYRNRPFKTKFLEGLAKIVSPLL